MTIAYNPFRDVDRLFNQLARAPLPTSGACPWTSTGTATTSSSRLICPV